METLDDARTLTSLRGEDVRAYVEYLRDLGVFEMYARGTEEEAATAWLASVAQIPASPTAISSSTVPSRPASQPLATRSVPSAPVGMRPAVPVARPIQQKSNTGPEIRLQPALGQAPATRGTPAPTYAEIADLDAAEIEEPASTFAAPTMPLISMNVRAPLPTARLAAGEKAPALQSLRAEIGDCTRCPLAYAGRHTIVFADGTPTAELMFVGEGPGADEDASGVPFVGKAGQLLNNMIGAMGLKREQVYIANVVMCRPPKNRAPEPKEADTCSNFLLRQIDIVQPKVVVALGATAAAYLLGVKQPLSALRGQWHDVRGAKCAVTYHPAFLLRDPRQKAEAWKDLQRVMVELKLKPPAREA